MSTRGERLKRLREELGLRQTEVAEKIGVLKQTLYKYENDLIDTIPDDTVKALASLYGVPPSIIFGWDDGLLHIKADTRDALMIGFLRRCPELYDIAEKYIHASDERKQIICDLTGVQRK